MRTIVVRCRRRMIAQLFVLVLVVHAATAVCSATTYYVKPGGSNVKSGTSMANAWAGINKACTTLVAGDTVYVAPGTYTNGGLTVSNAGTSGSPIKFVADPTGVYTGSTAGAVNIQIGSGSFDNNAKSYVQLIGFTFTTGNIYWHGGSGGLIQDVTVSGSTDNGIIVQGGTTTIDNCTVSNAALEGIWVDTNGANVTITRCTLNNNGGDGGIAGTGTITVTINRCKSYSNTKSGVQVWGGTFFVYNSLLYTNTQAGISVGGGSCTVYNSTIARNSANGIKETAGAMAMKNCILYGNTSYGILKSGGTFSPHDYNSYYSNSVGTASGLALTGTEITTDPKLTSAATNDYHLLGTSPCINTGTSMSGTVDYDYEGNARPYPSGGVWDMGAYEYQSAPSGAAGVRIVKWEEAP